MDDKSNSCISMIFFKIRDEALRILLSTIKKWPKYTFLVGLSPDTNRKLSNFDLVGCKLGNFAIDNKALAINLFDFAAETLKPWFHCIWLFHIDHLFDISDDIAG